MKFEVVRYEYNEHETIGQCLLDDVFFCWTLEDKVRPEGVKVYGETAIPEGKYIVTIEPFRGDVDKMYPYLHNVPMFSGVCMHGGNTDKDTLGCILVGYDKTEHTISRSAVRDLAEKIRKAEQPVVLTVRNGG